MPTVANKVLMGFSDLYVGTYTVAQDGTVTMGTPYHQAGAVGFAPSGSADRSDFYADNIAYYTSYTNEGKLEGDLVVAMFDDDFKKQFLGYRELEDGGLAQIKGATKPNIYLMFQVEGDISARKVIFYNGTFGEITREYSTIEDTRTPVTESLPVTLVGDNKTGITKVTYDNGDEGYETLFTNPPAPALPLS